MKKLKYIWMANVLIVSSWVFYIFIIPKVLRNKDIIIPDVTGYNVDDAYKMLDDNKLNVLVCYIDGTNDEVLYTFPYKNTKVKYGSNINLYVSKKSLIYYEEFIGLILDSNIDMIDDYCIGNGIKYKVEYKLDNDLIPGMIIDQSKKKDDIVNQGDLLTFTVAKSDLYFPMPNLIGMNIYDVLSLLDNYNLKANIIYYHTPVEKDVVIFQSISEGNIVKKGNSYQVDIYVSKGLELDIIIDYNNFIKVLAILDINYDIIYIESNKDINTCLGYNIVSVDNIVHYYIYISK